MIFLIAWRARMLSTVDASKAIKLDSEGEESVIFFKKVQDFSTSKDDRIVPEKSLFLRRNLLLWPRIELRFPSSIKLIIFSEKGTNSICHLANNFNLLLQLFISWRSGKKEGNKKSLFWRTNRKSFYGRSEELLWGEIFWIEINYHHCLSI